MNLYYELLHAITSKHLVSIQITETLLIHLVLNPTSVLFTYCTLQSYTLLAVE